MGDEEEDVVDNVVLGRAGGRKGKT
ncbi:uncharacterized protein G2W53_004533 [Senna tora]|uniref:Uncharacterized protein n=1 Tax=Senna tora TaxID=362788 RepID=A0A835CJF5_9FABA|nr:uncharacterized protein G2W53_004533 [Senna tora]